MGDTPQVLRGKFLSCARANNEPGDQQSRAFAEEARMMANLASQPQTVRPFIDAEARSAVEVLVAQSAGGHGREQQQRQYNNAYVYGQLT
eukprot:9474414-Pyramimonas_sp.AAC.1